MMRGISCTSKKRREQKLLKVCLKWYIVYINIAQKASNEAM
jgi:hypothetical protein